MRPYRIYLALNDAAQKLSFYLLEEWQLETFIRLSVEDPRDGFNWLWDNCSESWTPSLKKSYKGAPIVIYDMVNPESINELINDFDTHFPNQLGEDG